MGNFPTVVGGGDWNCTINCENNDLNVYIFNMRAAPNPQHSKLLKEICRDLNLVDPYRTKYPNRTEFTFVPKDITKTNRSRIDFFIVSVGLVGKIHKCFIAPNMQNKMFDHRATTMCFKDPPKVIKPPTI
jgi:exonuclease III